MSTPPSGGDPPNPSDPPPDQTPTRELTPPAGATPTGFAAPGYPPPADPSTWPPPAPPFGASVPPPPPTPAPRSGGGRGGWVALAVGLSLIAGLVGGVVGAAVTDDDGGRPQPELRAPTTQLRSTIPSNGDIRDLVARVERSVVSVQSGRSQGTGVVLSAEGEVLTNAHVIEGARLVTVTIPGENQSRRADVVAADADADLALLEIRGAEGLPPAALGKSSELRVGDDVVAIGNALGLRGDPSVTRGIVSGLGRSIESLTGLIQTDAAINPGNSGGPLVNAGGEVVGINTAVRGGAQNVGFAIPVDTARAFAERARTGQPAPAGAFLGISSRIPIDASPGAEVVSVEAGSGAERAGVRPGDRIVALDGKAVPGPAELGGMIRSRSPGDRAVIRLFRGDDEQTLEVTLGERVAD